jgi:transmembrane sensor
MSGSELEMVKDAAAAQAARWFLRLQYETAAAEDWLDFERWLAASPANAQAYARMEGVWDELDELSPQIRAALGPPPSAQPRRARRPDPRTMTRRRWFAAAAASAAGAGGLMLLRTGVEPVSAAPVLYEAPPGQVREVTLADGSRIRLNAGSRLSVQLARRERRVVMADAEATFDVAHDAKRPFLIQAGDRQVRVVGTEFNLRRRQGKLVLTVRRGLVEVGPDGGAPAPPTRVAPGQQLSHLEGSDESVLTRVDPNEAFGWTAGRLIYRDAPLSEVAADLGRRFGLEVRPADVATGETRFTGVLVLDDEAAVLQRLAALAPVEVERNAGAVVLRRR